jgi:hypothetical protein
MSESNEVNTCVCCRRLGFPRPREDIEPRDVMIFVLCGPTTVGMSDHIKETYRNSPFDVHVQPANSAWWEGYDDQEVVVLDDFDPKKFRIVDLLRLADTWPHCVQVRSSAPRAAWRALYITTTVPPEDWYPNQTHMADAVRRRIKPENCGWWIPERSPCSVEQLTEEVEKMSL